MLRFDSPWQTDTSISIKSWGYVEHDEYRTPKSLIDELIDVVSKNDTDRTTALVGFVRENGEGTSHLVADVQNKFCALTLSSLDARPISQASLLLLTATGRVENTGAVWNARHTMLDVWGTAPTRIEVIKGWLTLKQLDGAVGVVVSPLDGSGKPLTEVRGRRLEVGWEIPVGDLVATSYLVRVIR